MYVQRMYILILNSSKNEKGTAIWSWSILESANRVIEFATRDAVKYCSVTMQYVYCYLGR